MAKKNTSKRVSKKGPWVPGRTPIPSKVAEDLGLSGHRLQHGDFESEQVSIGHHRLRERSMLTHPALLMERRAAATKAYVDAGKELPSDGIRVPETPSDRATAKYRSVLWRYLVSRWSIVPGRSGSTNFEKSSHSTDLNRLPLTESQFDQRAFYGWLKSQPGGKSLTSFLNKVAAQCNPQAHDPDYTIMSKAEIGMWRIDTDNPRDAKNACDGALAQACEQLAEMAAHYAAIERQKKSVGKHLSLVSQPK